MNLSVFLVLVLSFICLSSAQVFRLGGCPDVPVQDNFNVDNYLGVWYEYQRYFFIAEAFLKCTTANYSMKADGNIRVVNSGTNRFTGNPSSAEGTATIPDPDNPAKLVVQFSRYSTGNYWVLKTDYSNYSLVYSCTNVLWGRARTEIVWILTRDKQGITDDVKTELYQLLRRYDIRPESLMPTDQTGCI